MMNVSRLWDMGITGDGVITALVDDGLDYESEDLADNFVSAILVLSISAALCLSL
jgi:kexin